jgi:hypothetical protein
MPDFDFDTRKLQEPNELNNPRLENNPRLDFVLYLLVVAVVIGLLLYSFGWLGSPATLLPGHDDEGFPGGLYGIVPKYDVYTVYEPRECPYTSTYTDHCYFVTTEADIKRSLTLIVEDIIRDNNIEESGNELVYVYFQTPEEDPLFEAYAFKDSASAKGFFDEEESDNMTVIDGVYLVPIG